MRLSEIKHGFSGSANDIPSPAAYRGNFLLESFDTKEQAMTLDYVFRMGELADIAEERFWSQANVVIVIAAVTGLVTLLKWVLA